jgi:hypothetical protein
LPGIERSALAAAIGVDIARISIPIERTGPQRVLLGEAKLANGIIRTATAELADPWPENVVFRNTVRLELVPVDGGDPIRNAYEHGWRQGIERVNVFVTFEPLLVGAGAVLTLVDVSVR